MDLFYCLCFFMSAEFVLEAGKLQAEADRVRRWNEPWARNLERKAGKMMAKARVWAGDKPPYGEPR